MLHSLDATQPATDTSTGDNGLKLWCELLLLYFEKASITSRSLQEVIGLRWRTVKKRLKSGTVDYGEVKILLQHCGVDSWRALIAVEELQRPEAYFDADIVWTAEVIQHVFRNILEQLTALHGDFIPFRKGIDSQSAKLVADLFAYQRRYEDFTV